MKKVFSLPYTPSLAHFSSHNRTWKPIMFTHPSLAELLLCLHMMKDRTNNFKFVLMSYAGESLQKLYTYTISILPLINPGPHRMLEFNSKLGDHRQTVGSQQTEGNYLLLTKRQIGPLIISQKVFYGAVNVRLSSETLRQVNATFDNQFLEDRNNDGQIYFRRVEGHSNGDGSIDVE